MWPNVGASPLKRGPWGLTSVRGRGEAVGALAHCELRTERASPRLISFLKIQVDSGSTSEMIR
jgi:hypothetical protein